MKHVTVIIPTRNRRDKLLKTIKTVPIADWISIVVMCDGDRDTFNYLQGRYEGDEQVNVAITPSYGHFGAVWCRNKVLENVPDGAICATDDVLFGKHSFRNAIDLFNETFPDDDGVVSFKQVGTSFHPTGVVLAGKKWIDRYPNRWMYCPEYWHFSCQEIKWLTDKYDKLASADNITLRHVSPMKNKSEMDRTHVEARHFKEKDRAVRARRKQAGLCWGFGEETAGVWKGSGGDYSVQYKYRKEKRDREIEEEKKMFAKKNADEILRTLVKGKKVQKQKRVPKKVKGAKRK